MSSEYFILSIHFLMYSQIIHQYAKQLKRAMSKSPQNIFLLDTLEMFFHSKPLIREARHCLPHMQSLSLQATDAECGERQSQRIGGL